MARSNPSSTPLTLVALLAPFALVAACGMQSEAGLGSGDDSGGSYGVGGSFSGGASNAGGDGITTGGAGPGGGSRDFSELCGVGPCMPGGLAEECVLSSGGGGSGGDGSGGDGSGGGGGAGAGGGTNTGGGGGTETLFCQLVPSDDAAAPSCAKAGEIEAEGPCQTAADCAPSFGCVLPDGATSGGLCRPYCCGDLELCPADTHCVPHPMIESPEIVVPVCTPVTPCELLKDEVCGDGETCGVVRADGTTSCIAVEGEGELCDVCPCAPGFICGQLTGTCQKLCHTDGEYGDECSAGTCQGGAESYPSGFGVCVGGPADACP